MKTRLSNGDLAVDRNNGVAFLQRVELFHLYGVDYAGLRYEEGGETEYGYFHATYRLKDGRIVSEEAARAACRFAGW